MLICPEREYLVWEYLCDFIDIEDKEARGMLSIIGSSIVMFDAVVASHREALMLLAVA